MSCLASLETVMSTQVLTCEDSRDRGSEPHDCSNAPVEAWLLQKGGNTSKIQELTVRVREQDQELSTLKKEVGLLLSEAHALKEITNELKVKLQCIKELI